jgi:hypothetical protein
MMVRKCDSCGDMIDTKTFIELTARVLKSEEGPEQDTEKQFIGDYCKSCLNSGNAIKDLIGSINS